MNATECVGISGTITPKKRILWIDIAKGIAIILVILGHTIPFGSLSRNLIFSFHMPLFFILSGMTFHVASSKTEILKHLNKNIKHLIFPVLICTVISFLFSFLLSENYTLANFFSKLKTFVLSLYWSSGVSFKNHPGLGMLWFLVSLFWAKFLIDCLSVLFKNNYLPISILLGSFGLLISQYKWLPQNFDVTLISMMFISVGLLVKKYQVNIEKNKVMIFYLSLAFWMYFVSKSTYIEMATRSYPFSTVCIIEALCGTYVFCEVVKAISNLIESNNHSFFKNGLLNIGRGTLLIFCIHHLDGYVGKLWASNYLAIMCLKRVVLVLVIYLFIKHIIQKFRNKGNKAATC